MGINNTPNIWVLLTTIEHTSIDKRQIVFYLRSWKYNANAFLKNQATCEIFCIVCCRPVVLKRGAVNHKGVPASKGA